MPEIWTVQKILNWMIQNFEEKNISEPRLSSEVLLANVLNLRRIDLYLQFDRILSMEERERLRENVKRRLRREPVQYITGETEFMGLPLKVSPAVLIPRPETEILTDCIIERIKKSDIKPLKFLDIGTGSGCIAIAIAKYFPEAEVWAIERSAAAINMARENAHLNGVNIHFLQDDVFTAFQQMHTKFNIVACNPPYVPEMEYRQLEPEVNRYEPAEALLGGTDGLDFYRNFVPLAGKILESGGFLFLETGYNQARAVANLFKKHGFIYEIEKDYNQIERVVILENEKSSEKQ